MISGRRSFQIFLGGLCIVLVAIQIYNDRRNTGIVQTISSQFTTQNQNDADKVLIAKNAAKEAGGIFVTQDELDFLVQKMAMEQKTREEEPSTTTKPFSASAVMERMETTAKTSFSSIANMQAKNNHTATTTNNNKKVFVCITGQLQRLILRRKLSYFFQPILDSGYEVDVGLVLTTGQARFTNVWGKTNSSEWNSYEDAVEYLDRKSGIHVLPRPTFTVTEEPDVPMTYLNKLDKENRTLASKKLRVRNHARQFEMWTNCYHHFLKNMTKDPTTNKYPYDAIMRFREDMAFFPEFRFETALKILDERNYYRTMVVSDCRCWNGINDRFAFSTPDIAKPMFLGPHARFSTAIARNDRFMWVQNPETYLYSTYKQLGIKLVGSPKFRRIKKYIFNATKGGVELGAREERAECPSQAKNNPQNKDWYFLKSPNIDKFISQNKPKGSWMAAAL